MLKPISTLRRPLEWVDLATREPALAAYERSDVCVVPAAGVIGEAMVAHRAGRRVPRKIRRRFAGRNAAKFRRLSGTGEEFLTIYVHPIVKIRPPGAGERARTTVTEFDTPELHQLVDDMFESMYAAQGVGLAAPQIGIAEEIAVIDTSNGEDPTQKIVLINPEIVSSGGRADRRGGLPEPPHLPRAGATRQASGDAARATPKARSSR